MHFGVTIDGPEYDQLGSHFGFHGERVEKLAELKGAPKRARRRQGREDRDPQCACEPVGGSDVACMEP